MSQSALPHMIHYCWFGGNALGEQETKCIRSWERFLPGFDIVRWDESNYDVYKCSYLSEAYNAKKWAFVSDYARFDILHQLGGLYFDTDVEVVRSFDDLIERGPFLGCEVDGNGVPWNELVTRQDLSHYLRSGIMVNPGLGMGFSARHRILAELLDEYAGAHFIGPNGRFNQTTVVARTTAALKRHGLQNVSGIQQVADVTIYPSEWLNPKNYMSGTVSLTDNTRSIHHYGMSWLTPRERRRHDIMVALLNHGIPARLAANIARVVARVTMRGC